MSPREQYVEMMERLKTLPEGKEADELRDQMDKVWEQLTEEDVHFLNGWRE